MIFAIQKDGRLTESSINFLKSNGIDFGVKDHPRHDHIHKGENTFVFLKYNDIVPAVLNNIVDFGIVGSDTIDEMEDSRLKCFHLELAKCKIVLAVNNKSGYNKTSDLNGKTIVSKFPNISKKYLNDNKVTANIHQVHGSCEVFTHIHFADAIIDIIETGTSLVSYDMKIIDQISEVEAVLVCRSNEDAKQLFPSLLL